MDTMKKEYKIWKEKQNKLLDLVINNYLSEEEFKNKNTTYNNRINELEKEKKLFQEKENSIEKILEKELLFNDINNYIKEIVDKIVIEKIEHNRKNISLKIYLFSSPNAKKIYTSEFTSVATKTKKNNYNYSIYIPKEYLDW